MLSIGQDRGIIVNIPSMPLVDIIIVLMILLTLGLVIMAISAIFLRAPYVPTPVAVCEAMIAMANLKGNEVIYDLGAGDARLLIQAMRKHPHITARGSELAFPVYFWAKIKIYFSGQKVDLRLRNLFSEDLRDADCIFLYLMPGIMDQLITKFTKELRPGTKIISYAFSLQKLDPLKTQEVPWIQGKKKIYLYEWQ